MKKEGKDVKGARRLRGREGRLGFIAENRAKIWKEHIEKIMNEENKWNTWWELMWKKQRWALPQIGPHIRKLRTQVSICGFENLISYRKYLRICCEKLKFTANTQSNRQCCLIRGKTAWKKWTLLFSGLEVNVRELMTFFFWRSTSGRWQNLTFKNKKSHHDDKIRVNNVV